ncbi:hypothetical protein Ciccas_003313 [Cichlidogyrus casuarinus]|uniref:Uncharacterized protein n=1 Tax=Cichlidogyrus casuarinus TaxID=1844966 RepID=A0ABD2QER0_9PLAT
MTNPPSTYNPVSENQYDPVRPAQFEPEIIGSRPLQDKFNRYVWSKYGPRMQQHLAQQSLKLHQGPGVQHVPEGSQFTFLVVHMKILHHTALMT